MRTRREAMDERISAVDWWWWGTVGMLAVAVVVVLMFTGSSDDAGGGEGDEGASSFTVERESDADPDPDPDSPIAGRDAEFETVEGGSDPDMTVSTEVESAETTPPTTAATSVPLPTVPAPAAGRGGKSADWIPPGQAREADERVTGSRPDSPPGRTPGDDG
jgi:hypothetical protein